jgi:hypothetical protein
VIKGTQRLDVDTSVGAYAEVVAAVTKERDRADEDFITDEEDIEEETPAEAGGQGDSNVADVSETPEEVIRVLLHNLPNLTLGISPTLTVELLAEHRIQFCERLFQSDGIPPGSSPLTDQQIHKLADLFFGNIFGIAGIQRVGQLVRYFTSSKPDHDPGTSIRANNLSNNTDLPEELRGVYRAIGATIEHEGRVNQHVAAFSGNNNAYLLYEYYNRCINNLSNREATMKQLVAEHKVVTGRGRDLASQVRSLICIQAGMSKTSLDNMIHHSGMVHTLVAKFGLGVLLLLPPKSGRM